MLEENTLLQNSLAGAQSVALQADKLGQENEKALSACDGLKGLSTSAADSEAGANTIEVFAQAAQTSAKAAEDCAQKAGRSNCQPIINDARTLLARGAIDPAAAKIDQARASGCDVTSLDEEIDYYKTLYEAVAMLKAAQNNCRFQEALDFVHRMPAGVQEKPLIRQALTDVQAGLNALMATRNLLEQARQAGVAQNITEQDRFLANAQSSALGLRLADGGSE